MKPLQGPTAVGQSREASSVAQAQDAEGRVLDPFECGGMDVIEGLRLYQESGLSKDLGFLLQGA